MKIVILSRQKTRYHEITYTNVGDHFQVVGGAQGWLDTSIAGSDVPKKAKAVAVLCIPSAAQRISARVHGGAFEYMVTATPLVITTEMNALLHMDFYRDAGNNDYYLLGYWT
jgi:hypothetical protein